MTEKKGSAAICLAAEPTKKFGGDLAMTTMAQDNCTPKTNNCQHRKILAALAHRGGRFVIVSRESKRPLRRGWNRPAATIDGNQALAALAAGYNVGLATGSGNLYMLDFDADADRAKMFPELAGALRVFRRNAPHKAKYIFQCVAPLPTRPMQSHGFDLLGWTRLYSEEPRHSQGVVVGVHPSGAELEWDGHHIPVIPPERVEQMFAELTGGEHLFRRHSASPADVPEHLDADLAVVREALRFVDPWALEYNQWIAVLAAIHDAFGGSREALAVAEEWGQGLPGEVAQKWRTFGHYGHAGAGLGTIFYLAKNGGWSGPPQKNCAADESFRHRIDSILTALHHGEGVEWLKSSIGARVLGGRIKTMTYLLQECRRRGLPHVANGARNIGTATNQSHQTVLNHLGQFAGAGLIEIEQAEDAPWAIRLNLDKFPTWENERWLENYAPGRHFWRQNMAHDAWLVNHASYKRRREQAGLPPGLAAPGPNGLLVAAHLYAHGPRTTRLLAKATGLSVASVRTSVRRLAGLGLIEEVGKDRFGAPFYDVVDAFSARLEEVAPHLATAGVGQRRERRHTYEQLAWAYERDSSPRFVARLEQRIVDLDGPMALRAIAGGMVRRRLPAYKLSRWDLAERINDVAQLRRVAEQVKGLDADDVARKLSWGGYDQDEIALVAGGRIWTMAADADAGSYKIMSRRIPKEQRWRPKPVPPTPDQIRDFADWCRRGGGAPPPA